MPSYLITGASRGIGYALLQTLAADDDNVVIGLVRDKRAAAAKLHAALGEMSNVHFLQGDMVEYNQLEAATKAVGEITGGSLDYIIANAAIPAAWSAFRDLTTTAQEPQRLEADYLQAFHTNVVGNVHLFDLFLPFVLRGKAKKVVHIASAQSDLNLVSKYDLFTLGPYAASKSAMNSVIAKYSAFYRQSGVLFLSIAPGVVDTEYYRDGDLNDEIIKNMNDSAAKFKQYAPHFEGPQSPMEAAKQVLAVLARASIENGDAGQFVSQFGNQNWL